MSFIEPIFAWNVPLVSLIFLKRSLVFPIALFSSIYLHRSLRKVFLFLLAVLWNSAFKWVYLSLSLAFPLSLSEAFSFSSFLSYLYTAAAAAATAKSLQSCPSLWDPIYGSPPGSSVPGILQARIPEWVAISFSRRSSLTRDWTCVSCIGRWVLYQRATREAHLHTCMLWNMNRVNCGHSYA